MERQLLPIGFTWDQFKIVGYIDTPYGTKEIIEGPWEDVTPTECRALVVYTPPKE